VDALLESLQPDARARIEPLLARRWSSPEGHPLATLQGASLGAYRLIVLLGPKNAVGSRYFQLFLADGGGRLADDALALGLHGQGPYPAFNWVELTQYHAVLALGGEAVDLAAEGLDRPLFQHLSQFAPAGGHMMVEYDSPSQRATERVLTLGYPPATSPIGYLMLQVGCRSYRDWYISEGGREGPRKLQGFRPLNEEIAAEKTRQLREEVLSFLSRPENTQHGNWGVLARRNGRAVVEALEVG
jgi:hypothetical protein